MEWNVIARRLDTWLHVLCSLHILLLWSSFVLIADVMPTRPSNTD